MLLLTGVFPPKTGGSGRWFWEIYRRLPRDRFVIAAGEDPRQEAFDRTHDLRLVRVPLSMSDWGMRNPAGLRGYWRAFRAVRRIVKAEGIGEIHCGACLPDGWVGWLLRRVTGTPYVCYMHGEELNYAGSSRELGWMAGRVLSGAKYLIANSWNTERILREEWGISPERIRVLHPGVDTERFAPAARDEAVRQRLGWGDRPVILTVGRLQKRKGHDMMIRALGAIRQQRPDVLYSIVGDGDERATLEELVRTEGLESHVEFRGEPNDAELVQCYQQCDVFVLANRQIGGDIEGFGMVLLEAQACGKPVIAGASGGTAETMQAPDTGRLVNCDGPEKLAETVAEFLRDEALRQETGRLARRWVVETFDWAALTRQACSMFGSRAETTESSEAVINCLHGRPASSPGSVIK